jgi:aminoglycoside phosphotransferase (APT) family kinase protein
MNNPNYIQAVLAFGNYHPNLPIADQNLSAFVVTPLSGGLINHTYKVESRLSIPFVLQQINQQVFPSPEDVQQNYVLLSQYAEFEFTGLKLPWALPYERQKTLFIDDEGNYWRAFEFIEDSTSFAIATTVAQAKATAKTFGKFTQAFAGLNSDLLKETIPRFHDLSFRYQQLEDSLQGDQYERMQAASVLIHELKQRERYIFFYEEITNSSAFPKRVMHHDAKIANILFAKKTGKPICAVDLDTAMPGYFFSDLGDMIRSMAGSVDENSVAFESITIRKDFYTAITDGYLSVMAGELTNAEKKHFHYAGVLIIYMQALRFATDYLNGDIYYKTDYAGQNFSRAKNQLTLLQQLEIFLTDNYNLKLG